MGICEDLTGQKFGKLTVIKRVENTAQNKAQWLCRCDCGEEVIAISSPLRTGRKTACPKCSRPSQIKDLTGQVFGRLTVLEYDKEYSQKKNNQKAYWKCQCSCGNITYGYTAELTGGKKKSCGCLMKDIARENMKEVQKLGASTRLIDLTGQRFGKLTVIQRSEQNTKQGKPMWVCQCDCGNFYTVAGESLKAGKTQSCGCLGSSVGETLIKDILEKAKIPYKREYSFEDLVDEKPLRYDFALFDTQGNLRELIEYDGRQHSDPNSQWYNDKVMLHDEMKTIYAKEHNIPLLRIPYTDRAKINLLYLLKPLGITD